MRLPGDAARALVELTRWANEARVKVGAPERSSKIFTVPPGH